MKKMTKNILVIVVTTISILLATGWLIYASCRWKELMKCFFILAASYYSINLLIITVQSIFKLMLGDDKNE